MIFFIYYIFITLFSLLKFLRIFYFNFLLRFFKDNPILLVVDDLQLISEDKEGECD